MGQTRRAPAQAGQSAQGGPPPPAQAVHLQAVHLQPLLPEHGGRTPAVWVRQLAAAAAAAADAGVPPAAAAAARAGLGSGLSRADEPSGATVGRRPQRGGGAGAAAGTGRATSFPMRWNRSPACVAPLGFRVEALGPREGYRGMCLGFVHALFPDQYKGCTKSSGVLIQRRCSQMGGVRSDPCSQHGCWTRGMLPGTSCPFATCQVGRLWMFKGSEGHALGQQPCWLTGSESIPHVCVPCDDVCIVMSILIGF